jgi:hypothetical protein
MAAVQSLGSAFASMFSAPSNANPVESQSPAKTTSLGDAIQSIAGQLRNWLGERGVTGDYSINYLLEGNGESTLEVTGNAAAHVSELLASDPSWQDKLRGLATRSQVESVQRGFSEPPPMTIEIDNHRESYY